MIIKQDYGTLTGGELEVESIITDVQKSLTAGKNYATEKTFIYDGKMYKATSDIAAGSAIVLSGSGANATPAGTVMDKICGKLLTSSDNLDNIIEYGYYTWQTSSVPINAPEQVNASMMVTRVGNAGVSQIVFSNPGDAKARLYIRTRSSIGTTTAWKCLGSAANTISTSTQVDLTDNTEYACQCDGYFRIYLERSANGYVIGYVSGLEIMRLSSPILSEAYLTTNICQSLYVKKGMVIKCTGSDFGTASFGRFYPLG